MLASQVFSLALLTEEQKREHIFGRTQKNDIKISPKKESQTPLTEQLGTFESYRDCI